MYRKSFLLLQKSGVLRAFPFLKIAKKWMLFFLRDRYLVIEGHKMCVDVNDSLGLIQYESYEPLETKIVEQNIYRDQVVLDIGANIGYYTLLFARLVGIRGEVFAFEPDPTNFSILQKNVALNGYRNVVLIPQGVSDRSGPIPLFLAPQNTGDHRIYDEGGSRASIMIDSIRIDDFLKKHQRKIDFIKMDIQGAEPFAIEGMRSLLKESSSLKLLTEFAPSIISKADPHVDRYPRLLEKYGFKLYEINHSTMALEATSVEELLKKYTPQREDYTNLLWVKGKS